jgi:ribosomal protein L44E
MRRPISVKFKDSEGKEITRSSGDDFGSLANRHLQVLLNLPSFEQDETINNLLGRAIDKYEHGEYKEALDYLNKSLERFPNLEPYIFYYIKVCKHVLSIPLTKEERQYEVEFNRYISRLRSLPKWLRWTVKKIDILVRCKWCGKYTQYIDPNTPTFGFTNDNCCMHCDGMYPMPSWMWDSPDGRAYSYYRQSFPLGDGGKQFYDEFLRDYSPTPTVEKSGLFVKEKKK